MFVLKDLLEAERSKNVDKAELAFKVRQYPCQLIILSRINRFFELGIYVGLDAVAIFTA